MRRSKYTVWLEKNYPKSKGKSLFSLSRYFKIKRKSLQGALDRGMGAFHSNPSSVRPGVSSEERWGKARMYKLIKNIVLYRKGDLEEIPKGRGHDYDIVEMEGKRNNYVP